MGVAAESARLVERQRDGVDMPALKRLREPAATGSLLLRFVRRSAGHCFGDIAIVTIRLRVSRAALSESPRRRRPDRGLRRACDGRDGHRAGTNADCRSHEDPEASCDGTSPTDASAPERTRSYRRRQAATGPRCADSFRRGSRAWSLAVLRDCWIAPEAPTSSLRPSWLLYGRYSSLRLAHRSARNRSSWAVWNSIRPAPAS